MPVCFPICTSYPLRCHTYVAHHHPMCSTAPSALPSLVFYLHLCVLSSLCFLLPLCVFIYIYVFYRDYVFYRPYVFYRLCEGDATDHPSHPPPSKFFLWCTPCLFLKCFHFFVFGFKKKFFFIVFLLLLCLFLYYCYCFHCFLALLLTVIFHSYFFYNIKNQIVSLKIAGSYINIFIFNYC
jgi:hypothetical protein